MSCDKQKCIDHGVAIPRDCIDYQCAHYESSLSPGCSTPELGLTHPTIHIDFYEWLQGLSEQERKHMAEWDGHDVAMWVWTQSRETLRSKA